MYAYIYKNIQIIEGNPSSSERKEFVMCLLKGSGKVFLNLRLAKHDVFVWLSNEHPLLHM